MQQCTYPCAYRLTYYELLCKLMVHPMAMQAGAAGPTPRGAGLIPHTAVDASESAKKRPARRRAGGGGGVVRAKAGTEPQGYSEQRYTR